MARCTVLFCNHLCTIKEGKRGVCGVRENRDGCLYSLNYGKTIASANDPIEKKPLYHFLPGSMVYSFAAVGCNFHCLWCQNWQISQGPRPDKFVAGVEITSGEHVKRALSCGASSIAYTYSEPTIFLEYALDTMKIARSKGLKNVWVTNGFMSKETLDLIIPYLDAANVDFKCPNDAVYLKFCGGKAQPIMENLKTLYDAGVHLEITTLVVPDVNDRYDQLEYIARFIAEKLGPSVPWHVTRFFPSWKMASTPSTPGSVLEMAREIGVKAGLEYVYCGNV